MVKKKKKKKRLKMREAARYRTKRAGGLTNYNDDSARRQELLKVFAPIPDGIESPWWRNKNRFLLHELSKIPPGTLSADDFYDWKADLVAMQARRLLPDSYNSDWVGSQPLTTMVENQILTPAEARQIRADIENRRKFLQKQFLSGDITATEAHRDLARFFKQRVDLRKQLIYHQRPPPPPSAPMLTLTAPIQARPPTQNAPPLPAPMLTLTAPAPPPAPPLTLSSTATLSTATLNTAALSTAPTQARVLMQKSPLPPPARPQVPFASSVTDILRGPLMARRATVANDDDDEDDSDDLYMAPRSVRVQPSNATLLKMQTLPPTAQVGDLLFKIRSPPYPIHNTFLPKEADAMDWEATAGGRFQRQPTNTNPPHHPPVRYHIHPTFLLRR